MSTLTLDTLSSLSSIEPSLLHRPLVQRTRRTLRRRDPYFFPFILRRATTETDAYQAAPQPMLQQMRRAAPPGCERAVPIPSTPSGSGAIVRSSKTMRIEVGELRAMVYLVANVSAPVTVIFQTPRRAPARSRMVSRHVLDLPIA